MSDKKNTVRVFNTFTNMYEDVEVSEEVYTELRRDKWRNEKRRMAISEREVSVNQLCNEEAYREEEFWQFADDQKNPHELLEDEEAYNELLNVIQKHLDPAMRRRFTMYYIENLEVNTIARIEGVNPPRVYGSIVRAKEKLQKILSKKERRWNG